MEEPRQQHRGGKQVLELPQWNSKFGFAAQKNATQQPPAGGKGPLQATPGRLGQARRVLVAAGGAAAAAAAPAAKHGQENQGPPCVAAAPSKAAATPQDAEKTPTLCLFERFERLTLATPSTAAPNTAATGAGLGRGLLSSAPKSALGSAGSTTSSTGSEQCVARVKPARRSVAFGTPSVLAYTPAQPMRQEAADCQGDEDRTPLWSNAGHTPYSLPGSTGSSGRILEELHPEQEEEQEEEGSGDSTALPLITASGIPRVCAGSSSGCHSSGVRMELFTSVIHEVTEEEGQVTPAGAAALRCPQTPLDVVPVPAGAPVVEQADNTGAGAHPTDAAAGGLGSDCDEGSECDMQLLTPATLPFSARLQRAAGGGSTTKEKPASSSKPTALTPARFAATAGERTTGAKAAPAGAASRGGAAAAAGVDAGSPSGVSSFTGFAGGAPAEQQAGSTTPTFFDGRRAGCGSKAAASSSLQNLLAGSSTATSGATPPAPASAARVGASRGAARAQTPVWVPAGAPGSSKRTPARTPVAKPSSSRAAAATPATGQRPQRTPAAAAGLSAVKAASSRAAVTPATRQQRTLNFGAAAAERGPAAAAAAACAAAASSSSSAAAGAAAVGSDDVEVFSSPPASMRPPPAITPKSKLRQPERVVLEARTPKPTGELHKLLDDADAAAAAAAVLAAGARQQEQAMLVGSCEVLSPVRARKHAQHTLGASEQVCTPVRRSARKLRVGGGVAGDTAFVGGGVLGGAPGAAAVVQPMLEATNYCYQPNEALQK